MQIPARGSVGWYLLTDRNLINTETQAPNSESKSVFSQDPQGINIQHKV